MATDWNVEGAEAAASTLPGALARDDLEGPKRLDDLVQARRLLRRHDWWALAETQTDHRARRIAEAAAEFVAATDI